MPPKYSKDCGLIKSTTHLIEDNDGDGDENLYMTMSFITILAMITSMIKLMTIT